MMAPLLLELSRLEVELLDVIVDTPRSEQDSSLDTFIAQSDVEIDALFMGNFTANKDDCCCCCCVCYPCF